MKRYASTALTIVCLAITGLGLYNVYGDNADVVRDAERTACGPSTPACNAQVASQMRTPFGQNFSVHTATGNIEVTCRRAGILVGGYACHVGS